MQDFSLSTYPLKHQTDEQFYHVPASSWLFMMDGAFAHPYLPEATNYTLPPFLPSKLLSSPHEIILVRIGFGKKMVIHSLGPKGLMRIFQTWDGGTVFGINGTALDHSFSGCLCGWRMYKWLSTLANFNKLRYLWMCDSAGGKQLIAKRIAAFTFL